MSGITLRHIESDEEVAAAFPVMAQLRPHLANAEELVARVAHQREAGYRQLAAWREGVPVALAGYRVEENLIHGRFLYLDDLVTTEGERRGGIGARLLEAVAAEARRFGCSRLVLSIPASTTSTPTASITGKGSSPARFASAATSHRDEDDPADPR
jgi:GNAT superfamily N-acetyltransferase